MARPRRGGRWARSQGFAWRITIGEDGEQPTLLKPIFCDSRPPNPGGPTPRPACTRTSPSGASRSASDGGGGALTPGRPARLTEVERNAVIAAARASSSAARREILQVRSFRKTLYICALALTVTVAGLLLLGVLRPRLVPLCFKPTNFAVCPSGVGHVIPNNANEHAVDVAVRDAASSWDIPIVALLGVIAAAISAAVALRKLHGTSTPYSLPVALAVLGFSTWSADRCARSAAHARRLRPRAQRAGQPCSDHRLGDLVRVRPATLHTSRRRPCSPRAGPGRRPRAAQGPQTAQWQHYREPVSLGEF